jgi:ubiquinone/menaquinone biosynthesis C-methylase UbiE
MNIFNSLPPAEPARQLANPEGPLGLEIAEWLNGNNAQANAKVLDALQLTPGCRVLEIGFGYGRAAANVAARATAVRYDGIDISLTMLDEAQRFNASLIASGHVSFHLVSAECMSFPNASFDRVFSTGVIHFWAEPLASLIEVRRVSRPDGLTIMSCLHPRATLPFVREEYGFHARSPEEWERLFRAAGFSDVTAECLEVEGIGPDGKPNKRYTNRITARP